MRTSERVRERMSLQLQMQTQLVTSRNQSHSLSFHGTHHPKPHYYSYSYSPTSNLTFRTSTAQQSLYPLLHKSSASVSTSTRPIQDLRIVANSVVDGAYTAESPARELRRILNSPGIHQIPACFDALSAKLVERAGFKCTFAGGNDLLLCLVN